MTENTIIILNIASSIGRIALLITAFTLPWWGYKLINKYLLREHDVLKVDSSAEHNGAQIIASLGTTTAGVFMIQILPLVFSIIGDLGADFNIEMVYGDHFATSGSSDYVANFYSLTAELSDMLQTAAPMAAVGLGGYNLLNNLSRGLPAIIKSSNEN